MFPLFARITSEEQDVVQNAMKGESNRLSFFGSPLGIVVCLTPLRLYGGAACRAKYCEGKE